MNGPEGVEGHYRPAIRRMGVGGFVKGAELFSVDEVEQRRHSRHIEEAEEDDEDESHPQTGATGRRRPRVDGVEEEEEEDPSSLYARLLGSAPTHGAAGQSEGHPPNAPRARKRKRAGFPCEVCGVEVSSVTREEHERSTLHIFNSKKKDTARKIVLPDSNRGVQLLSRLGWTGETGLGAQEQGPMAPARSILKLDTKGLGHKQPRAKVTHFPPHIPKPDGGKSAAERAHEEFERRKQEERRQKQSVVVQGTQVVESKQERRRREAKERREKDRIHRELHSDIPEGYEEYFT